MRKRKVRWSRVVPRISLKSPLRRHDGKETRSEKFCIASSYYLPEGRFYSAPAILKQKRRKFYLLPTILGFGMAICAATTLQNADILEPINVGVSVLSRSQTPNVDKVPKGVDPIVTGSIILTHRYKALPVTGEITEQKLGIADPNPDVDRVRRAEKSDGLNKREDNALPDLSKIETPRVSIQMSPLSNFHKTFAQLRKSTNDTKPIDIARAPLRLSKKSNPTLPIPKVLASLVTNDQADILALGYAPQNAKIDSTPFDSVLKDKNDGRFIPPIGKKDHEWAATLLPAAAFSPKEQKCLAEAVYFEARGESVKGQVAVAQVVLNRVRNPAYPGSICGVVYQNINWRNKCQFSFACDGKKHRITEKQNWVIAQQVSKAVTAGQIWLADVGSSTHYHATYVRPRWAKSMDKVEKIGLHIFYRTKNGGWS